MNRTSYHRPDRELAAGWPLLVASALGVGFGATGFATYAIGAFIDPLGQEFGWSRSAVQGAIAFGVGLGGLAAPVIGSLIDKYGGRKIDRKSTRLNSSH